MNKKGLHNLRLHFCRSICFLLPASKRTKLTSYNVLSRISTAKKTSSILYNSTLVFGHDKNWFHGCFKDGGH